jgi:hypothetical protein
MKQLQRLLFLQGNKCFFCGNSIPEGHASVEHLDALSNGGKKSDENSVACCKAVNAALGNLPLKEKFRVLLSYEGKFACPTQVAAEPEPGSEPRPQGTPAAEAEKLLPEVVENLRKRGGARPNKLVKLRNTVAASFPQASPEVVEAVLVLLKQHGYMVEDGGKLSYAGLQSGA